MSDDEYSSLLAPAFGGPITAAGFKSAPDDFRVTEILPFEADGEGHHWLLRIEKTDVNTLDMLDELSRRLKVSRRSIGYSGLKDRFAVTTQWVSVPAQTVSQDVVTDLNSGGWRVTDAVRHRRKLRIGSHRYNQFQIVLRQIPPDPDIRERIDQRLQIFSEQGVPNYFGAQRFGVDGANLRRALTLFCDGRSLPRQQHRFAVSAARSCLFNAVLSARVRQGSWNRFIDGDVVMLDGSNSWFGMERLTDEDLPRLAALDIHPSGPMWGTGEPLVASAAADLEAGITCAFDDISQGLAKLGMAHGRRALRMGVKELEWQWHDDQLNLKFMLVRGGFATAVLQELILAPSLAVNIPDQIADMMNQSVSST